MKQLYRLKLAADLSQVQKDRQKIKTLGMREIVNLRASAAKASAKKLTGL
jgi:hypothetical protein